MGLIVSGAVGAVVVFGFMAYCACRRKVSKASQVLPVHSIVPGNVTSGRTRDGVMALGSMAAAGRSADLAAGHDIEAATDDGYATMPALADIEEDVVPGLAASDDTMTVIVSTPVEILEDVESEEPASGNAVAAEVTENLHDIVGLMDPPDASALKVPAAAAEVGSSMFDSTFLADVGDGAVSGLLAAGAAAPIIGQVFTLLADLKKHLDKYIEAEEECRRMSVWCVFYPS